MKQRTFFFIFGMILFFFHSVEAETYLNLTSTDALYDGSPFSAGTPYTMPNAANSYTGWVWFPRGFIIDGSASLFIIPSVAGDIDFNNKTLDLRGDLCLASNVTINSANNGFIEGNGHSILLSGDLDLDSTLQFDEDTIIDGNNNVLTLGTNGVLQVTNGKKLTLKNIIIKDLNDTSGSKLVMSGATSQLILDNTKIWLNGNYTFNQGFFSAYNDVSISGTGRTFEYTSAQISTINKQSKLSIENGVTFYYNAGSNSRISMTDNTAELYLNGCTLSANATGLKLNNGMVKLDGTVTLGAAGGSFATGIRFNTATTVLLAEANAEVHGYLDLAQVFVYGGMSHFVLMNASTSHVNFNNSVTTFCGQNILAKGPYQSIASGSYDITDANYFLCKTVADLGVDVTNIDNFISNAFGPGNLSVNTTTTTLLQDIWASQHHLINVTPPIGGTTFDGATHFIHCSREDKDPTGLNPQINISGGNACTFTNIVFKDFVQKYITLTGGSTVLFGNGTSIETTNDVVMDNSYTISCQGTVTMNFFGNTLDLTNAIQPIDVLATSTLMIQNAKIIGLSSKKIKLWGTDSALTLSNCKICLTGTYNFSQGWLNFYGDNVIEGANIFDFNAGNPFTINKCSKLQVDFLTTFSYGPGNRNLFKMIDKTSKFFLNGCSFTTDLFGVDITKGTVIFDHVVDIRGATAGASGRITFGDSLNSSNDADWEILPGATVIGSSGYIQYSDLV